MDKPCNIQLIDVIELGSAKPSLSVTVFQYLSNFVEKSVVNYPKLVARFLFFGIMRISYGLAVWNTLLTMKLAHTFFIGCLGPNTEFY